MSRYGGTTAAKARAVAPVTAVLTATGPNSSERVGCFQGSPERETHRSGPPWTTTTRLRIKRLGVRIPPSAPAKSQVGPRDALNTRCQAAAARSAADAALRSDVIRLRGCR